LRDRDEDYNERVISQFVRYAGVPVVSLESATLHPLQSLADLVTIRELYGTERRPRVVLTWAPHVRALPQAVPNSFVQWMRYWDKADLVITHPEGYELDERYAGNAIVETNQDKALEGADFVYVKNWSSVRHYGQILSQDPSWMLTAEKLKVTNQAKVIDRKSTRLNSS